MLTINGFIQLSFLLVYSLKMVTGRCKPKYHYIFIIYRLELLIPHGSTILNLLFILFVPNINIFENFGYVQSQKYHLQT